MENANEHSASEKRHWVRITRACNNRCMFCLDRDSLDGTLLDMEAVEADLRRGIERGAERVIISGGEPTIHPDFTAIVKTASRIGYTWVQTITNGRMFYYADFLKNAVAAGLKEITFSLHSHKADVFGELTGIKDGFRQAVAGLSNALATPGLVVSVDIVLSRLNIGELKDVVDFYYRFGVREFDLLYPVPFGGAWENREKLMLDGKDVRRALSGVLSMADTHGITFWTNRVPVAALEGFERFIQPPAKIHDEIYGRREMFLDYLENGNEVPCRGERCAVCNMQLFCDSLAETRAACTGKNTRAEYIVNEKTFDAAAALRPARVAGLVFDPPELALDFPINIFTENNETTLTLLFRELPRGFPYEFNEWDSSVFNFEICLDRHTAPRLLDEGLPAAPAGCISLACANYESPDDCCNEGTSLKAFFGCFRSDLTAENGGIINVPPCIINEKIFNRKVRLSPLLHSEENGWDLEELGRHFILNYNYHHSDRCEGCPMIAACPGLHVNYIIAFGFGEIGA